MAVSDISKDIIHMRSLLHSMGFAQLEATPVHDDNTACIEWGNNIIGGRERAKHIDIRKHFAHETIKNGHMILKKVATTAHCAARGYYDQGSQAATVGNVYQGPAWKVAYPC